MKTWNPNIEINLIHHRDTIYGIYLKNIESNRRFLICTIDVLDNDGLVETSNRIIEFVKSKTKSLLYVQTKNFVYGKLAKALMFQNNRDYFDYPLRDKKDVLENYYENLE